MRAFTESELLPAYGPVEVARYLRLSTDIVKRWSDLLKTPDGPVFPISFANLLQLHLLKAMRVEHRVPLQRARRALAELKLRYGSEYPLLQQELSTDGLNLFIQDDDEYINLSKADQQGFREHFDLFLKRIVLNEGVAKLYPFVQKEPNISASKSVVITPAIGFGRPVVDGTGIHTRVIASRFYGGDSIADLLEEYQLDQDQFAEVIRWETQIRKDAA